MQDVASRLPRDSSNDELCRIAVVYGQPQALHTEALQIQHVESVAFIKQVCPGFRCPIAKSSVNGVYSLMSMRGDFAACRCSPPPPSDSAIAAGLATSLIGKEGFRQMRLTHRLVSRHLEAGDCAPQGPSG